MKNLEFLADIKKKGKIELIEPSDAIRQSYAEKSESNLISAKILLKNGRLEEAVSLTYYNMYHILTALMYRTGIKCENHTGSIILLKDVFGIDNRDIAFAKKERIDKQYYFDFHVTEKNVIDLIKRAERFNSNMIDFISKLNTDKITKIRRNFVQLIERI
ncbi:MAG: HEPN domain-containing protein [Candidatus Aenigmatarchaeota archaeon]